MTTVGELILDLTHHGISLACEGADLSYRCPAGSLTQRLKASVLEHKAELLEALADPRAAAMRGWEEAVEAVSAVWNAINASGPDAPWLEEELDGALQSEVGDAIRSGDLLRAFEAISRWREAWLTLLGPASVDHQEIDLSLPLNEGSQEWIEQNAARASAKELFDRLDDPQLPERVKAIYRAEILARADSMIAESEGRRPPPNPTVHAMFDQARRQCLSTHTNGTYRLGSQPGMSPVGDNSRFATAQSSQDGCGSEEAYMAFKFKGIPVDPVLPEGRYPATFVKLDLAENASGEYLKWTFEVLHNGSRQLITGVSSASSAPSAKARQWCETLLGRPLRIDEELSSDVLCRRPCLLELTVDTLKNGAPVNRVGGVLPANTNPPAPYEPQTVTF